MRSRATSAFQPLPSLNTLASLPRGNKQAPPKCFPPFPEGHWKWMWGGGRGHPGIAPDGLSSVCAEISSPSRLLSRPWWPGHSSSRARGIFGFPGCLPISNPTEWVWVPWEWGKVENPTVFLAVRSNPGKERPRPLRWPSCECPAGPAGVFSAGSKEGITEGKSPSLYILMSSDCTTKHLPSTPNLEANILEQN